jgi:hypothetical protein
MPERVLDKVLSVAELEAAIYRLGLSAEQEPLGTA